MFFKSALSILVCILLTTTAYAQSSSSSSSSSGPKKMDCRMYAPCDDIGATCQKALKRGDDTLINTYQCLGCDIHPKLYQVKHEVRLYDQFCGKKSLAHSEIETTAYMQSPQHQCRESTISSTITEYTEVPEKIIECGTPSPTASPKPGETATNSPSDYSRTKLRCSRKYKSLEQTSARQAFTSPIRDDDEEAPEGLSEEWWKGSRTKSQSVNDTGCPNPSRQFVTTCTESGDSDILGLSCE